MGPLQYISRLFEAAMIALFPCWFDKPAEPVILVTIKDQQWYI